MDPLYNLLMSIGFFVGLVYVFGLLKKNQAPPSSGHGAVRVLQTDAEFDAELRNAGSKPVLVDFTATWCGPCQRIAPYFVELSELHNDVVFLKVDVDQLRNTAQKCGVRSMPTFHMYVSGRKVDEFSGADTGRLKSMVSRYSKK